MVKESQQRKGETNMTNFAEQLQSGYALKHTNGDILGWWHDLKQAQNAFKAIAENPMFDDKDFTIIQMAKIDD